MEGGAAYAQTNDRWAAGQSAAWSAVQTATIPLNRVMPGGAASVSDMASGYMFAKLRGASDIEAFEGMVTQELAQMLAVESGSRGGTEKCIVRMSDGTRLILM